MQGEGRTDRRPNITDADRQRVRELFEEGKTTKEISQIMSDRVSVESVRKILHFFGLKRVDEKVAEERARVEALYQRWKNGEPIEVLAKEGGTYPSLLKDRFITIELRIDENNLKYAEHKKPESKKFGWYKGKCYKDDSAFFGL